MKKYLSIIALFLPAVWMLSCTKGDLNHLDLYKNKNLRLLIKTVDMDAGDNIQAKVGAIAMTETASEDLLLTASNVDGTHKYITVNTALLAEGDLNITPISKAWQFIMTYDFKANSTPYTITITPYFDDVAQETVTMVISNTTPKKGTLEFKTYE